MTRRATGIALLLVALVAAAYVTAARRTSGPPFDPGSTAPDGARGLVEVLDRFADDVTVLDGVPGPDVDTAVLLVDRLDRDAARAVEGWVEAGGTLLVADPASSFTPPVTGAVVGIADGACPVAFLVGVARLDVGVGRSYEVPAGAVGCLAGQGGAVVVVESMGSGTVVSLGGPDALTNERLDEADNAVLAVATLAPTPDSRVAFLDAVAVGGGDEGLLDLIGTPVWAALAQLAVAFGVVVAWRARRLGRPVVETQPVAVAGTELTRAVGRLLAANRHPERAAAILRDRARRELSGPLGLDLDATVDVVVDVVGRATTLSDADVRRAVADPVTDDDTLVEVASLLTRIREETIHGRRTVPT